MSTACLALPLPMTDAPRSEPEDGDLVRRAAAGNIGAFEQLYRRHCGRVHGAVWRLSGMNPARAEELTQEAFIRAWQKLDSFRFESAFGTWLHRLAVNVALMELRKHDAEELVDDSVLEAASEPLRPFCAGERADLERAIANLPPRPRAGRGPDDLEGGEPGGVGN